MIEAAAQIDYPASRGDLITWFAEHYPHAKASTVQAHVTGLTDNDRNRHHYAWLARREPLFTRTPDGLLTAFEAFAEDREEDIEVDGDETPAPRLEFALEAFLEQFLLANWEGIGWGRPLELWESEAELGHQLATPVGPIGLPVPRHGNRRARGRRTKARSRIRSCGGAGRAIHGLGESASGSRRADRRRPDHRARAGPAAVLCSLGRARALGTRLRRRLHALSSRSTSAVTSAHGCWGVE